MKRTVGNNEWLDIDVLDDYLEGKLDTSMMHKVERVSLDDPFVAQALAGLTEAKKRTQALSFLQKQLQERLADKPVEKKRFRMTSHRLSIAATAAVLFLTVSILFWFRENNRRHQAELAAKLPKNIQVDIKPELATLPPVDTLVAGSTTVLLDQKKVEQALDNSLEKGNSAIAKSKTRNTAIDEVAADKSLAIAQDDSKKASAEITSNKIATVAQVAALENATVAKQVQTNEKLNTRAVESDQALNEVVVVGYGEVRKKAVLERNTNALKGTIIDSPIVFARRVAGLDLVIPVQGWKAFEDYLVANNKLFKNGTKVVDVQFTVKKSGTATNIKVLKNQTKEVHNEAVRLLKEGPKWKYNENGSNVGVIYIKF